MKTANGRPLQLLRDGTEDLLPQAVRDRAALPHILAAESLYGQLVRARLARLLDLSLIHISCMGVGGALFLVYILLRKDKQRADRLLARGTGRIWFEAKLVLAFLLVFFCMPRTQYLGDVWQDLVYSDTPQSTASGSTSAATYDPETGEWASVEPVYEYGYSFEQAIGIGTAVTTRCV